MEGLFNLNQCRSLSVQCNDVIEQHKENRRINDLIKLISDKINNHLKEIKDELLKKENLLEKNDPDYKNSEPYAYITKLNKTISDVYNIMLNINGVVSNMEAHEEYVKKNKIYVK